MRKLPSCTWAVVSFLAVAFAGCMEAPDTQNDAEPPQAVESSSNSGASEVDSTKNDPTQTSSSSEPTDVEIANANDDDFAALVLEADGVVLVDFWAPWCGPCRQLNRTVKTIAGDYQGKVTVVKVNVDEAVKTASSYRINAIPTLLVVRDGKVFRKSLGAQSESKIAAMLDKALGD